MRGAETPQAGMTDLVICGVGPFAQLMHFYFRSDSEYRVVGFTADEKYLEGNAFCGVPAVPFDTVALRFPPECVRMFVAIGYRHMRDRRKLFERAKSLRYNLASYIAGGVVRYPDLRLGVNNVAMAGVIFEPFVQVGDNNVFWSGTLVCHEAKVGSHNYAAARCVIGGGCVVRDGCFMGNGSVLIDHVELADETHVAPASAVMRNTSEFRRYAGSPAREIGSHEEQGIVIERG